MRGFDRVMPAFGEALDEAQIRGIMGHIRTFCTDDRWPRGEHTFFHDLEAGTILAVGGEVLLLFGSESRGLCAGVTRFEPLFAWGQILPSDSFVQAHAGLELSTDPDEVEHEAFWRVAIGRSWTAGRHGRTWTPMVEVLGARALEPGAAVDWAIAPQVQVTLNTRQYIMLDVALQVPLNRADRRSTRLLVYLLWDRFDGGLLAAW